MKNKTKILVQVALLVAVEIVLERFCSISTPFVRIGFGFVPVAMCGMLYGPLWGGVAGGLSDLVGALAFPFVGAYFPGFTLSSILSGAVFGWFLHRRREIEPGARQPLRGLLPIAGAAAVNTLGVSLLLSTLWVSLLYGTPYFTLLPTRAVQALIMLPVQFFAIWALRRPVLAYQRRTRSR